MKSRIHVIIWSCQSDLQGLAGESQRLWPIDGDGAGAVVQPDAIMADTPTIGSGNAVELQNMGLPILPAGTPLQYGCISEGVRGAAGTPHTVAPP